MISDFACFSGYAIYLEGFARICGCSQLWLISYVDVIKT